MSWIKFYPISFRKDVSLVRSLILLLVLLQKDSLFIEMKNFSLRKLWFKEIVLEIWFSKIHLLLFSLNSSWLIFLKKVILISRKLSQFHFLQKKDCFLELTLSMFTHIIVKSSFQDSVDCWTWDKARDCI